MPSVHRLVWRSVACAAVLILLVGSEPVMAAEPGFSFLIGPYPSKGLFEYRLDAADFRKTHPTAKTLAIVIERDGKTIKNDSEPIDGEGRVQGYLDVGKMPDGALYNVTGTVVDAGGQSLGSDTETFTRHVMPFESAQPTGLSDIIVPPFTAPVMEKSSVSCIERTYQHGSDGLLTQVIAAGEPLLASPVVFKARVGDGQLMTLKGDEPKLAPVGKGRASYSQTFSGEGITLKVEGAFDYDGFYLFTVHVAPTAGPVVLHDLRLDLPYREQIAQLIDAAVSWRRIEGEHKECLGALDPKQGVLWDSKTFPDRNWPRIGNMPPYLWLGDDDRGMVYSCASSQGMHDDENLPAAQVERSGDAIIYTVWFVNSDLRLSSARQFQFALQASPFKPMTEHSDLWRNAGYREPYKNGTSFTNWFTDGSYPTYGRFLTLPLLKKYRDATGVDQAGTMASAVSECGGTPEYQQFWHEWGSGLGWNKQTPRPPEEWAVKMMQEAHLPVNPFIRVESVSDVSATNRDYRVWWYNQEVLHSGISFIYQDNPPDVTYYDPPNGYGYTRDDGRTEPTSAIWNSRTFMKRIATTAIEDGKTDCVYLWANAINPALPGRSFVRKMLNGEYLYTKLFTLSQIRVLASHQWGMGLDWYPFPQTEESPYPNIGPVRKYWRAVFSRLLLHDITNFSGGDDSGFCSRWIDALDLFWLDDPTVQWHAYYRPDAIKANHDTTYVSTYTAKGRALLFVSNQASDSVVEGIPLSELARLGQGDLKYFYDAETGEQIETDNALHLFIPGDDYRVVLGFPTPWQFAAKNALGKPELPAQSTLDPEDTLTAISKQLLTSRTLGPVANADSLYEQWMQRVMTDLPDSPDVQYLDAKSCSGVNFEKPGIQASLFYDKRRGIFLANYYNDSNEDVRLSDNVRKQLAAKVGQSGHEYVIHPVTGISEWAFIDIPSHRGLLEIWYPDSPDFWGKHDGPFKASDMLANIRGAVNARQKEMGGRPLK
jgi:hypothetical protein